MLFDHIFAVLLLAGLPLYAQALFHWLERRAGRGHPEPRLGVYRIGIVVQWLLVTVVAARWWGEARPWTDLGLGRPAPGSTPWSLGALFAVAAVAVRIWNHVLTDPAARAQVLGQFAAIEDLLPRTRRERDHAALVALTAGFCEELLFRGFLFWWLRLWLPELPAMGLVALAFGLCHLYQGWTGVLKTAGVGAALGAVVLLTDALWLAIALHAFLDWNSLGLAHALLAGDGRDEGGFADQAPLPTEGEFEDEGWG
ncbi:MAG: CPBP family intramembrane metalloprotease [Planctomycetota bacterium]|nr:MAG: CPBP family intramembrane metalloprotease [Planctomycetota bacterium]